LQITLKYCFKIFAINKAMLYICIHVINCTNINIQLMQDNTKNTVNTEPVASLGLKAFKKGFWRGYGQVQQKDAMKVRAKLFRALNISLNSPVHFNHYLNGRLEPSASKAQAIEAVFAEYGITDVWGPKE
jgi:hypothetical protein